MQILLDTYFLSEKERLFPDRIRFPAQMPLQDLPGFDAPWVAAPLLETMEEQHAGARGERTGALSTLIDLIKLIFVSRTCSAT